MVFEIVICLYIEEVLQAGTVFWERVYVFMIC